MKTQGRGDSGGRVPPPHDDYDDYDDVELSAEDTLEVNGMEDDYADEPIETPAPQRRAGSATRPGSNGSARGGNGSAAPSQGGNGNGSRVRPPIQAGRPSAANLPKRRQRTTEVDDAVAAAPIPPPPTSPSTRPNLGGERRRGGNGAATASTAVEAPATRGAVTAPTHSRTTPVAQAAVMTAPQETFIEKASRLIFTYENLIYLGIFVLALVTRFWDLGNRGIHHDESLHAVFSRTLYVGGGYTHDPMMHGPIQFNLIAAMYWLFGTSDATARFASAFCGIFVVMSPFFLRRQMGRWPALIASFLLLVSPGVLYFSRMAREDSIFSAMEMIMIVGLWRFISMRRPGDFFVFCAGLSLMFTIKETAYLTVAVLGVLFALLFAFQAGYAILGAFLGYGAAMGGMYLYINSQIKSGLIGKLPDIPVQNPDYGTITTFAGNLIGHPLVQWAVIITLAFIGVLVYLFVSQRRKVAMMAAEYDYYEDEAPMRPARPARPRNDATQGALPTRRTRATEPVESGALAGADIPVAASTNGHAEEAIPNSTNTNMSDEDMYEATEVWSPNRLDPKPGTLLAHYQPGSIPHLIGALFSRPSVLLIGFLIAATIFVVLYSVFFTDLPRGIASGLFASLGYWMAQHDVERGGQPWYYYLLLIPLYQPIAVFFSIVSVIFFSDKGIKGWLKKRQDRLYSDTYEPGLGAFNIDRPVPFAKFNVFLPLFAIWWLAGAVFIYSWAGEKMPWLMVHMTRPAIFVAALFLGALVASIIARRQRRLEWERSYYEEEVGAPTMPLVPQGRRPRVDRGYAFRMPSGAPNMALATAGAMAGPPTTANFAYAQPRRQGYGGAAKRTAQNFLYEQEAPWVAWNRPGSKFPALSFLTLFTLLCLAWGMKMNALVSASNYTGWWVSWLYPGLLIILMISYSVWLGPARVLRYVALAIFSVFFLYEFKSGMQLTYQHPDVPIEMATYVQTSPSVTRAVKEIEDYSMYSTGGLNTRVVYDSFASWPFEWYFRDFKNKQFIAGGEAPTGADYPILVLEYAKHNNDPKLNDYLAQRYAMRWWFPEEWYKNNLIQGKDYKSAPMTEQLGALAGTTLGTFTNPQMSATLWKYLMFRETPHPLGSEDMIVFVRRDIAQIYHYLQYKPPSTTDTPPVTLREPPPSDGSSYR